MVQIEYKDTEIAVPTSWDDITLDAYERAYAIDTSTNRGRVEYVATICSIDMSVLLDWPTEVFNSILNLVEFLFADNEHEPCANVKIGGVNYTVPVEGRITLGMWVDTDEVQKSGKAVLSNTLAIVCRPSGEDYNGEKNEARAAIFAAAPMSKLLGVLAFFLQCKTACDQHTEAYSNACELVGHLPRSIKDLRVRGGGIKLYRIWQVIRYLILIRLLRARLQKYSRFCNISTTRATPKRHNID